MRSRLTLVLLVLCGLWGLLFVRAAYLQILPNERLEKLKKRQFQRTLTLRPHRGTIRDHNGKEMAVSVEAYSLFADPKLISQPKQVSRRLAKVLGKKWGPIYRKLKKSKSRRFVWIERRLDKATREKISQWGLRGLGFVKEAKRVYPAGDSLSHVLGIVGSDGKGLEGLELSYDDLLSGQELVVSVQRDARGRPLVSESQLLEQKVFATDVELTIDSEIQYVFERELAYAVQLLEAERGVGIVIDVETSEVRAMVTVPTFNANRPFSVSADDRRNRALTDFFEPGSTMKTFVVAGALREKLIQPNTKFFCENGRMRLGRRWIRESDSRHKWGDLTVSEILAVSSNICSAKIGFELTDKKLKSTLSDFGFGEKFGLPIPGEAKGILQDLPWRKHLLSNVSIGHGVAATPIQIAAAYTAIANGGQLVRPLLVKGLRNSVTGELERFRADPIRRVLSEKEAETLGLMLMQVTSEKGTGQNARVEGFPVAGKTGTAQKVDPNGKGYLKGAYISSFAGYIPAHDPKFVIYVAVDNPKKKYYGSQVAAPVFSRVASFAVRKAGLSPVLISEKNLVPKDVKVPESRRRKKLVERAKRDLKLGKVPQLKSLTVREVIELTSGTDLRPRFQGDGVVFNTVPEAGRKLPKSGKLKIKLAE